MFEGGGGVPVYSGVTTATSTGTQYQQKHAAIGTTRQKQPGLPPHEKTFTKNTSPRGPTSSLAPKTRRLIDQNPLCVDKSCGNTTQSYTQREI